MTRNDFPLYSSKNVSHQTVKWGFMQKMKAGICDAFHHINNIYQAVISLDREQTKEITAEDGLIRKSVGERKENTRGSRCARIFDIFDKSSCVCLTLSGHMLQQTRDSRHDVLWVFLSSSPSCAIHGSSWDRDKINNVRGD